MRREKRISLAFLISFWIFYLFSFCQPTAKVRFIKVYFPNGKAIVAELAQSDEERQRGLMFREEIRPDQGMLFIFEEEGYYSFWMKNTRISLDILWLDGEKRIVHIEENVPPCPQDPCPSYMPKIPALYVLELKSGSAKANQLKLYEKLDFILPVK